MEITSGLSPYSALSLVQLWIHALRQSTRLLEDFWGCPDSAANPHAFLDVVVDKCRMVQTVQKLWSPQLVLPVSVSVHGRLSNGNGFSDIMDNVHFWRR